MLGEDSGTSGCGPPILAGVIFAFSLLIVWLLTHSTPPKASPPKLDPRVLKELQAIHREVKMLLKHQVEEDEAATQYMQGLSQRLPGVRTPLSR